MGLSVGSWFKQNWFCTCSSKAAMTLPSARDITSVYITRANSYCSIYTIYRRAATSVWQKLRIMSVILNNANKVPRKQRKQLTVLCTGSNSNIPQEKAAIWILLILITLFIRDSNLACSLCYNLWVVFSNEINVAEWAIGRNLWIRAKSH